MRAVVLGSGGAFPTEKRMLPSVALLREGEMFILDCGEGTQLQLGRSHLGWARLTTILISHLHGDHIIGLAGLLMTMSMGDRTEPLFIYGPPGVKDYVDSSRRHLKFGVGYPLEIRELAAGGLIREEKEYFLEALPVRHRVFTLAYRLREKERPGRFDLEKARALGIPAGPLYKEIQSGKEVTLPDGRMVKPAEILGPPRSGRTVVFMVDTRPFPGGIEFARGADLLLHDGMFDDALTDEARERGHSTAREAAEVAKAAGVGRLVLVHISPRYQSVQALVDESRSVFPETRVARDLDSFEISLKD